MNYKEELQVELETVEAVFQEENKKRLDIAQEVADLVGENTKPTDDIHPGIATLLAPLLAKGIASNNRIVMYADKIERLKAKINIL